MRNRLPWQNQLIVPATTARTVQPRCGQVLAKPTNTPGAGWVTTTPAAAKIAPPPSGMVSVVVTAPLAPSSSATR
jgi:hypothetical protein